MGMYTELILGCEFSKNTPDVLIKALDHVINYPEEEVDMNVQKFIREYDLNYLLFGSSYYFGVNRSSAMFWKDTIDNSYHISTRSNIKNYTNQIEKFLEYIKPYVERGSGYEHRIYAYVQYESDEFPTVYAWDGRYEFDEIVSQSENTKDK